MEALQSYLKSFVRYLKLSLIASPIELMCFESYLLGDTPEYMKEEITMRGLEVECCQLCRSYC